MSARYCGKATAASAAGLADLVAYTATLSA
jgi:hypothetical protein